MSNMQNDFDGKEGSDLDANLQLDLNFCGISPNQETFEDLSKNKWNGKLSGTRREWTIGSDNAPQKIFENYLILNNSKQNDDNQKIDYVKLDSNIIFDCPKGITVETWVKLKRIDSWYYRIFDLGGDLSPKPNTIVNITIESSSSGENESNRGGFTFYLHRKPSNATRDDQGHTDPSRIYVVEAPYRSITVNQWTHLAVVANFEEKSAKFFVNGRLVGENRNAYREQPYNRVELLRDNRIGATEGKESRSGSSLDGGIAHLRMYSRPLSQEEIFKRMAVKLIPTLGSKNLAKALDTIEDSVLGRALTSLNPNKLRGESLSNAIEKITEENLRTQNDKTWESLKKLFSLQSR